MLDTKNISVIYSRRKTLAIEVKPEGVIVRAPFRTSKKVIMRFLDEKRDWIEKHCQQIKERQERIEGLKPFTDADIKALALQAKTVIPQRVEYYAPIVGVDYGRITIRCQRTRWGSCSSKGNLNFNCLLMLMPEEVIDSVVVHELCHRKHMNHSAAFYEEVYRVFPEYKQCREWLKIHGREYMARLKKL